MSNAPISDAAIDAAMDALSCLLDNGTTERAAVRKALGAAQAAKPDTAYRLEKPKCREGWYWQTSEDGAAYGPHETHEAALQDMWADGTGKDLYKDLCAELKAYGEEAPSKEAFLADYEWLGYMAAGPISTDCFDADDVLDWFEETNEERVWHEAPPEWPNRDAKRELEKMLADALYQWADKHDAWTQFRGLS